LNKLFRREPTVPVPGKPSQPTTVTSISFDDEGGLLLTSESDSSMQIYNLKEGKHHKTHLSQKYGCMHAMFSHASGCIIHSSTKINRMLYPNLSLYVLIVLDTIRYLSTHDNSYLRYFEGHEQSVTCLALHPGSDHFLSCSEDNTLRIWDVATKNACGRLNLNGAYLSAWDPSGNVFAVASPTAQAILLYDFRNYDKEPFSTFDILPYALDNNAGWNKLEFSNDGKSILLGTSGRSHLLMDAFDGHLKAHLRRDDKVGSRRLAAGEHNPEGLDSSSPEYLQEGTGDCCFTPDGRYVVSGSRKENVLVWDTLASAQTKDLKPSHELEYKGDSAIIAFNPRYNLFATGDKEVVFWVPDQNLL